MPNINNINTPVTVTIDCGNLKDNIKDKIKDIENSQDIPTRIEREINIHKENIEGTIPGDNDKIVEEEEKIIQLENKLDDIIEATIEYDSAKMDVSDIIGENFTGEMVKMAKDILSDVDNDVNRFIVSILDKYGKALKRLDDVREDANKILPNVNSQGLKEELDEIKRVLALDTNSITQELIDCDKKVDILLKQIPGGVMPLVYDTSDDKKLAEISNVNLVLDLLGSEESGYQEEDGNFVEVPILSYLKSKNIEKLTMGIQKIIKNDNIDVSEILVDHVGKDWMKMDTSVLTNHIENRSTQVSNSIKGFPTWQRVNGAIGLFDLMSPFIEEIHTMSSGFIPRDFDFLKRGVSETKARFIARYMYELIQVNPDVEMDKIYNFSKSQIDLISTSPSQKMFSPILHPGKKSTETMIRTIREGIKDKDEEFTIDSSFHNKKENMRDLVTSIPDMLKKGRLDLVFSMLYALKKSAEMVAPEIALSWEMDKVVIGIIRGNSGITRKLSSLVNDPRFDVDIEMVEDKDGAMVVSNPYNDVEYTTAYANFIREKILNGIVAPESISVTSGPVKMEDVDLFNYVMGKSPYDKIVRQRIPLPTASPLPTPPPLPTVSPLPTPTVSPLPTPPPLPTVSLPSAPLGPRLPPPLPATKKPAPLPGTKKTAQNNMPGQAAMMRELTEAVLKRGKKQVKKE